MIWFDGELESNAMFWRVERRDGVTLGFTAHDRDLVFAGVTHRAAPGMVPSAIRRSAGFEPDSAEVAGALSHDAISAADLTEGRFDGARVLVGLVDWESPDADGAHEVIYAGTIGAVSEEAGRFAAELLSLKAGLSIDPIPHTSPMCRAAFCGPGCMLSAARFAHEAIVAAHDLEANTVTIDRAGAPLLGGTLRWIDGPHAGRTMGIIAADGATLTLDAALAALEPGLRITVIEGCDRRLETCATRFGNAVNFQGEPFLPGNDMVARYPSPIQ